MTTPTKTLTFLLQRSTIDDHEEVLRACNASLKASKNDIETQHIKFVALLKLDRYDDALRVLEESEDKLKQRAGAERAYALYKVGELDEAKKIARGVTDNRGARHVEAQAVSRLRREVRRWSRVYGRVSYIDLRILRAPQCCIKI